MFRPTHFEIQAAEPERAMHFYSTLFGWQFRALDGPMPYWLIHTGPAGTPGINGGLQVRVGPPPMDGLPVVAFVCTLDVPDLGEILEQLEEIGGRVLMPRTAVPGVGWLSYVNDTEGNVLGLMQRDPLAQ